MRRLGTALARERMGRVPRVPFVLVLALLGALTTSRCPGEDFRLVFSSRMFADINENDGRAAVRAWAKVVAEERNIRMSPDTDVIPGVARLLDTLRTGKADAAAMPVDEYLVVARQVATTNLLVGVMSGTIDEEYVLLVHRDSGLQALGDLRGRRMVYHENPRACLALPWLETLLADAEVGLSSKFFASMTSVRKVAGVVLPVFFRKADACLTTRRAWNLMTELNPQVGQRLKALAASPALVPVVMFLRADYQPPEKERLLDAIRHLHDTPAGQQVLTIFQIERLDEHPPSCLDTARGVWERFERLAAREGPSAFTPGPPGTAGIANRASEPPAR